MKNIRALQVIKDGQVKLTVPNSFLRWEGEYPLNKSLGDPFVSRVACEAAGLDPKAVQADFRAGRRSLATDAPLCLKFGMNPDGNNLVDEQVESDRRSAEYAVKAAAEKRVKYSKEIAEAAATGKDVTIHSEKWTEMRRVKEGGEWGDYQFGCSRTEWVTPTGEFKSKTNAVNFY